MLSVQRKRCTPYEEYVFEDGREGLSQEFQREQVARDKPASTTFVQVLFSTNACYVVCTTDNHVARYKRETLLTFS